MDWVDKESRYEEQYRSGRQATNLWKYIPKRVLPGVADCSSDIDGYWVWLYYEDGWSAYDHGSDCGVIHEYTIADLKAAIKTIEQVGIT